VGRCKCVGNKKFSRSVDGRGQGEEVSNLCSMKSGRGVCGLCGVVCDGVWYLLDAYGVSECVCMFRWKE
jgi:phage major head subunit gpT-like protein